jgi:phosphoesterase RecJ-like protein
MDFEKIRNLANFLKKENNFLLLTHKNFDFDAISSLLSMSIILDYLKKDYFLYMDEEIKNEFLSLPNINKISSKIEKDFKNVIFLDCERKTLVSEEILKETEGKYSIFIDHHLSNTLSGDENYVFPEALSTTQILYYLKEELKIKDKNLAELILLGILGDTKFLTIEKDKLAYKEIFKIILNLLEEGANYFSLIERFYFKDWENFKYNVSILSKAEKLDDICYLIIRKDEIKDNYYANFSNQLSEIKDIKIAFVLREFEENKIKISLRSKGDIDVSYLAKKYFNGGGHKNAAGGMLEMDLESALNFTLEKIKEYLGEEK